MYIRDKVFCFCMITCTKQRKLAKLPLAMVSESLVGGQGPMQKDIWGNNLCFSVEMSFLQTVMKTRKRNVLRIRRYKNNITGIFYLSCLDLFVFGKS